MRCQSEAKVSSIILYVLLGVTAIMFVLFYSVGYHRPFDSDPDFNAPALTDTLIIFTLTFTAIAIVTALLSTMRGMAKRDAGSGTMNGINTKILSCGVAVVVLLILSVTFVLGTSSMPMFNDDTHIAKFWLKASDMFINSSIILMMLSVAVALCSAMRNIKRSKN